MTIPGSPSIPPVGCLSHLGSEQNATPFLPKFFPSKSSPRAWWVEAPSAAWQRGTTRKQGWGPSSKRRSQQRHHEPDGWRGHRMPIEFVMTACMSTNPFYFTHWYLLIMLKDPCFVLQVFSIGSLVWNHVNTIQLTVWLHPMNPTEKRHIVSTPFILSAQASGKRSEHFRLGINSWKAKSPKGRPPGNMTEWKALDTPPMPWPKHQYQNISNKTC